MSSKCIRDTVNKVKAKYQESDPYRLAAAMHIIVKKLPLGTDPNCCKGFCMREFRKTCIVINCDLPEIIQQRCFHRPVLPASGSVPHGARRERVLLFSPLSPCYSRNSPLPSLNTARLHLSPCQKVPADPSQSASCQIIWYLPYVSFPPIFYFLQSLVILSAASLKNLSSRFLTVQYNSGKRYLGSPLFHIPIHYINISGQRLFLSSLLLPA